MGRPERPLDPDAWALQRFAYDLRVLRREAGQPSYRELARRAHYSDTTLSVAASGAVMPSLAATLAFVRACGGDTEDWERRWRSLATEFRGQRDASSAMTPLVTAKPEEGRNAARSSGPARWLAPGPGRRWRRAAVAGALAAATGAAIGLVYLGGGGSPAAKLAGPGCSPRSDASFAAHGAWQHSRNGPGGGLACDGEYLTITLASAPGPAPGVAEWSFDTGDASRCLLWGYLPKFNQDAGIATYDVFTAGQQHLARFLVDQSSTRGSPSPKVPTTHSAERCASDWSPAPTEPWPGSSRQPACRSAARDQPETGTSFHRPPLRLMLLPWSWPGAVSAM